MSAKAGTPGSCHDLSVVLNDVQYRSFLSKQF